jgi:hypothetical protein
VGLLFDAIRVRAPGNVPQTLLRLRDKGLTVQRDGGGWSLTPLGDEHVSVVFGKIRVAAIEADLVDVPGAEFDHAIHHVLPPTFAPTRWSEGIKRLLDRSPFERNVFCMTRFPSDPPVPHDPVPRAIEATREVLDNHGLSLLLASDSNADDELWGNVGAHMWASQYGIGFLEDRVGDGLNPNVTIELGSMIITGRRCAILKDTTAPNPPTDLSGQIYKPLDLAKPADVADVVERWVTDDLGLGAR